MKSNSTTLKGFFFDKKQCIKKLGKLKKMKRLIGHLNNPGLNPLLRMADLLAWPKSNEKAFIETFKVYVPFGKKDYELATEYIGIETGCIDLQEAMKWIGIEERYITTEYSGISSLSSVKEFMINLSCYFVVAYLIAIAIKQQLMG